MDNALFELEFGDAEREQSADISSALDDRHQVPGAVQLLGGRQTGGT